MTKKKIKVIKETGWETPKKKKIIKDYKKGFEILYGYFDYLPDEDKKEIDKRLKKVGL